MSKITYLVKISLLLGLLTSCADSSGKSVASENNNIVSESNENR